MIAVDVIGWGGLALLCAIVGLPAIVDLSLAAVALFRRAPEQGQGEAQAKQRLIFLVPAHNEELLVQRCVRSLLEMQYPRSDMQVVVVADNCTDLTASLAAAAGAVVLERSSDTEKGKSFAIGWALDQLKLDEFDAVVIVDADTIVLPDFASALALRGPLRLKALQTYDGMSNEFENWLTRMAGILTRSRYGIALQLKEAAGLNAPLTGDGTVLGTGILQRLPWSAQTITEGWELYARYTLEGVSISYVPEARLFAQETRSLSQSRSQRERWTAGRLSVFRIYWARIIRSANISLLQRLDLIAELTNLGPVMRGFAGLLGMAMVIMLEPPASAVLLALASAGILQPGVYALISVIQHPEPGMTLLAFLRFPGYALWRFGIGMKAFVISGTGRWVRTNRHLESEGAGPKDSTG